MSELVGYKGTIEADIGFYYASYNPFTGRPYDPKPWDMWIDKNNDVYIYEFGQWVKL